MAVLSRAVKSMFVDKHAARALAEIKPGSGMRTDTGSDTVTPSVVYLESRNV